MPDITMCKGDDCPFKEKCHRYTAEPEEYQSYFLVPPFTIENGKPDCEMFWGQSSDKLFVELTSIYSHEHSRKIQKATPQKRKRNSKGK